MFLFCGGRACVRCKRTLYVHFSAFAVSSVLTVDNSTRSCWWTEALLSVITLDIKQKCNAFKFSNTRPIILWNVGRFDLHNLNRIGKMQWRRQELAFCLFFLNLIHLFYVLDTLTVYDGCPTKNSNKEAMFTVLLNIC